MLDKSRIYLVLEENAFLRILTVEDVCPSYIQALNDPVTNQNMVAGHERHETEESVRAYVEEHYISPDSLLFGAFVNSQLIGTSRLYDFSDRSSWMGILMLGSEWRGKGWGSRVVKTISDYAFSGLNSSAVRAAIYQRNEASRRCFTKAGFARESIDHLYEGPVREIWAKLPS